ncbi:MAG: hypothetical protein U0105_06325 [Candidatus Obscuribacterales bacterium]
MSPEQMAGRVWIYAVAALVLVLTALLLPDLIAKLRKVELTKPADHPLFRNGGVIEVVVMLILFPSRLVEACSKTPAIKAKSDEAQKLE